MQLPHCCIQSSDCPWLPITVGLVVTFEALNGLGPGESVAGINLPEGWGAAAAPAASARIPGPKKQNLLGCCPLWDPLGSLSFHIQETNLNGASQEGFLWFMMTFVVVSGCCDIYIAVYCVNCLGSHWKAGRPCINCSNAQVGGSRKICFTQLVSRVRGFCFSRRDARRSSPQS